MSKQLVPQGRIVIAGGSGFLGRSLADHLSQFECDVVLLSRNEPAEQGPWRFVRWDARHEGDWISELDGATAVINLAGRTVDCVKTPENCDEILRSRVEATEVLGQAMQRATTPPPVWVQMSTAHIYGDPPTAVCDESSAPGYGLAPTVGKAWEQAHRRALLPSMRSVVLRTTFVLGRRGGAFGRLARLAQWGLGGKAGHGRQGISWIHEVDMNRIFVRAICDADMKGTYVVSAPNPVSNAVFMRSLRRALRQPIGLPAPAALVQIGAPLVLKTDPELALLGRYCVPKRLLDDGFRFEFPQIEAALADLA